MEALDHIMPRALEHLLGPEWKQRLRETVRTFMAGTTPGELRRAEVRARRSAAAAEANRKRWAEHNAEKARLAAEGGNAKPLPVWTVERDNMLARDWPSGVHTDVLWPALNALPGPPIRSVEGIKQRAVVLKLKREVSSPETAERRRAAILKANAARLAKHAAERGEAAATVKQSLQVEAPEPVQAPSPSPQARAPWIAAAIAGKAPVSPVAAELDPWASTNPYRLTEEAEAEALAMLRAGQGAKALHEEFGGRLDWWQAWAARARQAGRAA